MEQSHANPAPARSAGLPGRALRIAVAGVAVVLLTLAAQFPWTTDAPLTGQEQERLRTYYASAYEKLGSEVETGENAEYVRTARQLAEANDIRGQVARFAARHGLEHGKVLDIGAGRGYLQDIVPDYTGLDISASARRFFHKKFVLGSATSMPFADSEFDGAWSIWVLEHVPNPEAALAEMRRVLKHDGVLMLAPAWNCNEWLADGYFVRPYGDFNLAGKLVKASIMPRLIPRVLAAPPIRLLRQAYSKATGQPLRLHYRKLEPNYEKYWMPDSDALNGLDRYETALWFMSRGDECLNCSGTLVNLSPMNQPLCIRIKKQ